MSHTILLYGATGFSGRLIAGAAARRWSAPAAACRLVLGARESAELKQLAHRHAVDYRAFGLDDRAQVLRALRGVKVLVNAAGPFAWTAERLAKAAVEAGCHYVDINGEVDVYKRLDDLGRFAAQRQVAIVCSAGHMSTTSDLLLDAALQHLGNKGIVELGTVRFAMSRVTHVSRGSTESALRSLREQVTVVREADVSCQGGPRWQPVLWHLPVGALERTFDFGARGKHAGAGKPDLRIASAVNLVDTLTARVQALRHGVRVHQIESYMETGTAARVGYQLGAFAAPLLSLPWVGALARAQIALLPEGPTAQERAASPHVLLLEIEDAVRTPVIEWRLIGPNIYDVTAEAVTAIAERLAEGGFSGWCTPAEALGPRLNLAEVEQGEPLQGCRLEQRVTVG